MDIFSIIFIAIGLAADAFALSAASGAAVKTHKIKQAFKMAIFFGVFQGIMPLIGWFAGFRIRNFISDFDHWIAFGLLAVIGIKMIYESTAIKSDKIEFNLSLYILFMLAVATSIDALAVGFSLSFLNVFIVIPSIVIGIITFILSLTGFFIGNKIGHILENKIEAVAGLILIGIGVKILLGHLFA